MHVGWHGDTCIHSQLFLTVLLCVPCSQAESLLRELQARVTLRTTPRKSSKKRFDFSVGRSPDEGSRTSPMLLRKQEHKEEAKERETMEEREAPDRLPLPGKWLSTYSVTFAHIPHTLTPTHIPTMPHPPILTPSYPHTFTYTYHATPSHPHTLIPSHLHIYLPCTPILTPSHLHISPPHPSQSWVFLISLRLKLKVTKVTWRRRRMSVPSA